MTTQALVNSHAVHTQAGKVARLFARFDLNDDGRLDLFELTKLACEPSLPLLQCLFLRSLLARQHLASV